MPLSIIKETIELKDLTTDSDGNAYVQKKINLRSGFRHSLRQVDLFEDAFPFIRGGVTDEQPNFEIVISPYPQIPTTMLYNENTLQENRYVAAGDDSVLFKANGRPRINQHSDFFQFPSPQIAAQNKSYFYTDHIYINLHYMGVADTEYGNIALSFMMVLENTKIPLLEATMGILAESHDAMCAQVMSTGYAMGVETLRGNVFPMWRFGGIRPELTLSPFAAGSFFLDVPSTDEELMQTTAQVRSAVADARSMGAYDEAFGDRFPDWCRMNLNEGIVSGPVRDQWPPLKHADNGNVLCL